MKKTAVIFKTKYGSTKKYAEWISEALECDIFEGSKINIDLLADYDIIIYGGGLYASGINGIDLITKNYDKLKNKKLIVFTVGLADPNIKSQFTPILNKNFNQEMLEGINIFHLRGGIDYKKLGLVHKSMMAMLKRMVKSKKEEELTDEDRMMLETYGDIVDFTDKTTIEPILAFAKE